AAARRFDAAEEGVQFVEMQLPHVVDGLALDGEEQPGGTHARPFAVWARMLHHHLVEPCLHPELLVPDPRRSIIGGCFVREAFKYNPDTWDRRVMYSLSKALGFSLDTPWTALPETVRHAILEGLDHRKIALSVPPEAKVKREEAEGKPVGFGGIARRIERHYRRYRQRGEASSGMEAWLDKVMVEHTCP